jgi:hypothetical protein
MDETMATTLTCARTWLLALLIAGSSAAVADDTKHLLRYRFTPGETAYFVSRNETVRKFTLNARDMQSVDSVDTLKHYKVLEVTPEGEAQLELMIDRAKMSVDDGTSKFGYDSTKDKNPPAAFLAVHGTVGRPWLRMTVNSRGETTNHQIPGGMKVPESGDYISRVLPVLPEQPVKIGESWKEPFTVDVNVDQLQTEDALPLKMTMRLQRVYKLESVENGIATLALRTEVLTPKRTPKQDVELIQRRFSGSITIDIANGRLLTRDLAIDGAVVGYDGPMSAMSVTMTQKDVCKTAEELKADALKAAETPATAAK